DENDEDSEIEVVNLQIRISSADQVYAIVHANLSREEVAFQDRIQDMNWNETAADQSYDKAQFHLGNIYEKGKGMVKAYKEEGLNLMNKYNDHYQDHYNLSHVKIIDKRYDKARLNVVDTMMIAKGYYEDELNLVIDEITMEKLYDEYPLRLVNIYKKVKVIVIAKDHKKATRWDQKAEDQAMTIQWYTMAADQSYDKAQFHLGNIYEKGKGVVQSYKKAVNWYQKAADQGYDKAQFHLGDMYKEGRGVVRHHERAIKWYKKAAKQGYNEAQFNLGHMYEEGKGVVQSYEKAFNWYQKAADQGYDKAQFNLSVMYKKGRGIAKDDTQAAYWKKQAADQGYAKAQSNIVNMYKKVKVTAKDKDYKQFIMWFILLASSGLIF
ncbi:MAG: sel1 repeat family protein, partial [Saccharospirillaceae bacterium]|nr:sel1 repeat family protein [Saccharospirillaceae bacterium]